MGVYIRGVEMPKDCPMCPMAHWNSYDEFTGCKVVAGKKYAATTDPEYMESTSRPDWCPLVPVPPHGRLIAEYDAIETAWMILAGLGYRREENPQLEQSVRDVFATAPAIEVA